MRTTRKIASYLGRLLSMPELSNLQLPMPELILRAGDLTSPDRMLLDIGCGLGDRTLIHSASRASLVIGVEIAPIRAICAYRRALQADAPIFIVIADAAALPFPANCFGHIVSHDTWEHLAQPEIALQECRRVLEPSATIAITMLPYYSPWGAHAWHWIPLPWLHVPFPRLCFFRLIAYVESYRHVNARLPPAVRQPWHDPEDPAHAKGLTVKALRSLLASSGLAIQEWQQLPVGARLHPVADFLMSWLAKIPYLDELLTGLVIVEARKLPDPFEHVSV